MDTTSPLTQDDRGNMQLRGVPLVGSGLLGLVARGDAVGAIAAVASLASFTAPADGNFLVVANVLVTVATTHAFNVVCTYTDEGGTSRTFNLNFTLINNAAIVNSIANANGAVPYLGIPQLIRAKSGTPIVLSTSGTFTTVTYNVRARLYQDS